MISHKKLNRLAEKYECQVKKVEAGNTPGGHGAGTHWLVSVPWMDSRATFEARTGSTKREALLFALRKIANKLSIEDAEALSQ